MWIKSNSGYWYDLSKAKWIHFESCNTISVSFGGEDIYDFSVDEKTYKLVKKWLETLHRLDKRDLGVKE